MADIQKITDVPLFTNEQNQNDKKLIVLSPSSLPFDDNPTKDSHNLVDSNTIYNLSGTLNDNIKNADDILSGKLQTQIQNIVPIGTIIAFAGNTNNAPTGYLFCGGGEVSRTAYAKLFAVIGITYGAGDGETTFKLPDLKEKFIMGNITAGIAKAAGLPNITGIYSTRTNMGAITSSGITTGAFYKGTQLSSDKHIASATGNSSYYLGFSAKNSNSIYGNSTTVQPPSVTMRFYIKYK